MLKVWFFPVFPSQWARCSIQVKSSFSSYYLSNILIPLLIFPSKHLLNLLLFISNTIPFVQAIVMSHLDKCNGLVTCLLISTLVLFLFILQNWNNLRWTKEITAPTSIVHKYLHCLSWPYLALQQHLSCPYWCFPSICSLLALNSTKIPYNFLGFLLLFF